MENKLSSPLMPKSALDYFMDGEATNKLYLRATSIRNCLENIVETIFVHVIDDKYKNNWSDQDLNGKLIRLKKFFPKEINARLHKIRKVGNKGAHQSEHKNLVESEINLTLSDLSLICEWTILSYFKKNGFVEHPWMPTVFSTLPPVYRIRILEELIKNKNVKKEEVVGYLKDVRDYHEKVFAGQIRFDFQVELTEDQKRISGFLLLVDKLAMAYLKNRERSKSIQFVKDMLGDGFIDSIFMEEMLDKLDVLWGQIDNLPISTNLEEASKSLSRILVAVEKKEESLFITLFTAIIGESGC